MSLIFEKMHKSQKGSVFITVIFIVSILMIMLGGLMAITTTDVRISESQGEGIRAYYLADSGIQKALAYTLENRGVDYLQTEDNIFSPQYSIEHSITWSILYDVLNDSYTITSHSVYGKSKKNLRVVMSVGIDDKITLLEWVQE